MILNEGQEKAAQAAVDWFWNSSEQYFSITGHAGTGKSVVIAEIIRRLNLHDDEILPMAYTGQACTIMRTKGFTNACTCHSALFDPIKIPRRDKTGHIIYDQQHNVPLEDWSYTLKDFTNTKIKLIILDEAWMAPLSIRKVLDNLHIKVLAAGDPGQLPPVADRPGFLMDGIIYHLSELMRQSENSPIVYLANRARNGLPIEPGVYGNSVFVMFQDEITDDLIAR